MLWLLLACLVGCSTERAAVDPEPRQAPAAPPAQAYLLHLPGIGGHMAIDDNLIAGLKQGNLNAEMTIYNWAGEDRGIVALGSTTRHAEQAARVAELITKVHRADPRRRIIITSHSAGTGIAVWALEQLPPDIQIDTLLMMQSALSPKYDLSSALAHVHGCAYSLWSPLDPVVGGGTKLLGTVDRVQTEAAGHVGFKEPRTADAAQYRKLTQFEYQESWMRYGDIGDHIGPMRRSFAKNMLAPLLITGKLPNVSSAATTQTTAPSQ
jgi:hypothetical protein